MPCVHHYLTQASFTVLKILYFLYSFLSPSAQTPGNQQSFNSLQSFTFSSMSYMIRIIQYGSFSDYLPPLSNKHLKLLRVFSWLDSSIQFIAEWYSMTWMYRFVYPFNYQRASWLLPILAIMNKATINICV